MTDSEQDSKHHSAAKKELRSKLCQQMEFYFSDSNLTKDRFLKKEIENSPNEGYIDLSVFLKFNKIRSLTSDLKQIVKSLKHSELLEINEDETQIRRKVPFVEPNQKDVDKRTIYIEDLPINKANNEAIKTHFEQFGKVCYISMPKFKTSSQSKGFAFIEFEDKSGAKTAIEHYDKLTNGKVYDHTTIGKFPRANAQVKTLEKKIANLNIEISELETELNPAKSELLVEDKSKEASKKRPHKEEKMEVDEHPDQDEWAHLKVISKKAWLQLRDDFLNRQKQEINDLKTQLTELTEKTDRLRSEKENREKKKIEESAPQHERGCIIKLVLDSNNDEHFKLLKMTRQQFKEAMLKDHLDSIAYVDVEKTSNRVLVRCKSAEMTQKLIADEKFLAGFQRTLLDGKQEEEYFDKIEASRNKKMEKKERKDNKGHKNDNQPGIIKKERLNEKASDEASNTDRKKLKVEAIRVTQSGSNQHIIFDD